jgi:hypothetical protein
MFSVFPGGGDLTRECEHYVDTKNAYITAGTASIICCDLSPYWHVDFTTDSEAINVPNQGKNNSIL